LFFLTHGVELLLRVPSNAELSTESLSLTAECVPVVWSVCRAQLNAVSFPYHICCLLHVLHYVFGKKLHFFKCCLSSVGNAACEPDKYIFIDMCLYYPENIVVIFLPMGRGGSIMGYCSSLILPAITKVICNKSAVILFLRTFVMLVCHLYV